MAHYTLTMTLLLVVSSLLTISMTIQNEDMGAQEFIQLTTRYPMTDDPRDQIRHRTTKSINQAFAPYPFMDYFHSTERAEKWPQNTVYYTKNNTFRKKFDSLLDKCFQILWNKTCVNFKQYTGQNNIKPLIISSTREYRCIVTIGYNSSGSNRMILNDRFCKDETSILHLLMHVLGFDHEHLRKDRNLFVKLLSAPDVFILNALDIRMHHNSYQYMPYNWRSIMQIRPAYPFLLRKMQISPQKRNIDPSVNPYRVQHHGPLFKDWFSNPLHQFDVNNVNRHYQCGEYSPLCKDYYGLQNCTKYGLGEYIVKGRKVKIAILAQCKDEKFTKQKCPKTCGGCIPIYKHDLQLSSEEE